MKEYMGLQWQEERVVMGMLLKDFFYITGDERSLLGASFLLLIAPPLVALPSPLL